MWFVYVLSANYKTLLIFLYMMVWNNACKVTLFHLNVISISNCNWYVAVGFIIYSMPAVAIWLVVLWHNTSCITRQFSIGCQAYYDRQIFDLTHCLSNVSSICQTTTTTTTIVRPLPHCFQARNVFPFKQNFLYELDMQVNKTIPEISSRMRSILPYNPDIMHYAYSCQTEGNNIHYGKEYI